MGFNHLNLMLLLFNLLHFLGRAMVAVSLVAFFELLVNMPVVIERGVLLLRKYDPTASQLSVLEIFLLLLLLVGFQLLLVLAFLLGSSNLTDLEEVIKLIRVLVVFDLSANNIFALESSDLIVDDLSELVAHPINVAILNSVVSLLLLLFDFDLVAFFPVELINLLLLLETFLLELLLLLDESLLLLEDQLLLAFLFPLDSLLLHFLLFFLLDLQHLHLFSQLGLLLKVQLPLFLLLLLEEPLFLHLLLLCFLDFLKPFLLLLFFLQPNLSLSLFFSKPLLFFSFPLLPKLSLLLLFQFLLSDFLF